MPKNLIWVLLVIIIVVAGYLVLKPEVPTNYPEPIVPEPAEPVTSEDVQEYVRTHITALSPEPAVLGGTFYVTAVEAGSGKGTVSYEDGHIALTADFTYDAALPEVRITSFTVREE